MSLKSLIQKMDELSDTKQVLNESSKAEYKAKKTANTASQREKNITAASRELQDVMIGKLPKEKPGASSVTHKTPDFDVSDDDEELKEESNDSVPIEVRKLYTSTYAKRGGTISKAKEAEAAAYAAVEKKYGKEMCDKLKKQHAANREDVTESFVNDNLSAWNTKSQIDEGVDPLQLGQEFFNELAAHLGSEFGASKILTALINHRDILQNSSITPEQLKKHMLSDAFKIMLAREGQPVLKRGNEREINTAIETARSFGNAAVQNMIAILDRNNYKPSASDRKSVENHLRDLLRGIDDHRNKKLHEQSQSEKNREDVTEDQIDEIKLRNIIPGLGKQIAKSRAKTKRDQARLAGMDARADGHPEPRFAGDYPDDTPYDDVRRERDRHHQRADRYDRIAQGKSPFSKSKDVTESTVPTTLAGWMNLVEGKTLSEAEETIDVVAKVDGRQVPGQLNFNINSLGSALQNMFKNNQATLNLNAPEQTNRNSTSTSQAKAPTTSAGAANQPQQIGEEEIDEVAAPGQEDWIKKNKQRFIDQYGKKKGLSVLYATAWKRSKDKKESVEESMSTTKQQVMEGYTLEDIEESHPHEVKMCQEGWGLDESLYQSLAEYYHKQGKIPRKVWHGSLDELRDFVLDCYLKDKSPLLGEQSFTQASPGDSQFGPVPEAEELDEIAPIVPALAGAAVRGAAMGVGKAAADTLFGNDEDKVIQDDISDDEMIDMSDDEMVDISDDDLDSEEFPFPDMEDELEMSPEDELEMSPEDEEDMEQDDLLDEVDYMEEEIMYESKMKKHKRGMAEEKKETKTGVIHKAEAGGYGRKDDEDDEGKKVKKDTPKRGRGRPKKDADSETGEVKKWDTDELARWIVGSKPKTLPGKASVKHKLKDESVKKKDAQMESWDRQLQQLLNEGMTVTTSTGQNGMGDSVSVSATDEDAQELMKVLQSAGIGMGSGMRGASEPHSHEGQQISVEPASSDEVMGQLHPEDDGGDDALGFIKKMIGLRGGDTSQVGASHSHGDYEEEDHDHDDESCDTCGESPCCCDDEESDEKGIVMVGEEDMEESNEFVGNRLKAIKAGKKEFKVGGKSYKVTGDTSDEEKMESKSSRYGALTQGSNNEIGNTAIVDEFLDVTVANKGGGSGTGSSGGAGVQGVGASGGGVSGISASGGSGTGGSASNKNDQSASAAAGKSQSAAGGSRTGSGQMEDKHDSEDDEEHNERCDECGGIMEANHACGQEKLDEWANSPMGKSVDEQFQTELDYMTKLISGGLNGMKRDQTTLPHTKVKTDIAEDSIKAMKKLAGI